MHFKNFSALFIALFLFTATTYAQLQVADIFTDHAVLQREQYVPVWGTASAESEITVTLNGKTQKTTAAADGHWMLELAPMKAGGPYTLTVNDITFNDIYVGDVWICSGQSNMDMTISKRGRDWAGVLNAEEEAAAADYPEIKILDVWFHPTDEAIDTVEGEWQTLTPEYAPYVSAVAYFFARDIYKKHKVPMGLITTTYGGSCAEAWASKEALEAHPNLKFLLDNYANKKANYTPSIAEMTKHRDAFKKWKQETREAIATGGSRKRLPNSKDPRWDKHHPAVLYNGMIAPLIPYAIKGAIWYQGESNQNSAHVYEEIMETLIEDWRSRWGVGDFPFLYVQLANYGKTYDTAAAEGAGMTRVRDAQLKNLSIPNTAMAVAIDNADPDNMKNIHPKNKQEIGRRLALAARAKAYGEDVVYSGPVYDYALIKGNEITIYFKDLGKRQKLVAKGGALKGFAIAGADKKFVHAEARIVGNTIVVSSKKVKDAVAVRYGWNNNPEVNLYNSAGLPASPFRTDNWSEE